MLTTFLQILTVLALWQTVVANECSNGTLQMVNGTVEVVNQTYTLAGGLQACLDSTWVTVCTYNWDQRDAMVACRQLGLSFTSSCTDSCFGNRASSIGLFNWGCSGTESQLFNCSYQMNEGCTEAAGVTCEVTITSPIEEQETTIPETETTIPETKTTIPGAETTNTTPSTEDNAGVTTESGTTTDESSNKLTTSESQATKEAVPDQQAARDDTLVLALGVIAAVFGVALVLVLIFLLITCFKLCKAHSQDRSSRNTTTPTTMGNIAYEVKESPNSEISKGGYSRIVRPVVANQKPVDLEDNYDVVPSSDNTDAVSALYSVPMKKNKNKSNKMRMQMDKEENEQGGGVEEVLSSPDKQTNDTIIYSNIKTPEYSITEP